MTEVKDLGKVPTAEIIEMTTLKKHHLAVTQTSRNIGEPWNTVEKFFDDHIVELMAELVAWRTGEMQKMRERDDGPNSEIPS